MATNNSINYRGPATNGQLQIGSTGAAPALGTITAGTGISVTNGAASATIGVTGGDYIYLYADTAGSTPQATTFTTGITVGTGSYTVNATGGAVTVVNTGIYKIDFYFMAGGVIGVTLCGLSTDGGTSANVTGSIFGTSTAIGGRIPIVGCLVVSLNASDTIQMYSAGVTAAVTGANILSFAIVRLR